MVSDIENDDVVEGLRRLFQAGGIHAKVFNWMGSYERSPSETSIERLANELSVSEFEARDVARELEGVGCGRLLLGRKGNKTRMVWEYNFRTMVAAAKGTSKKLQAADADEVRRPSGGAFIEHQFAMRPDYIVTLTLPADITAKEADRFATFIRSIPFSD